VIPITRWAISSENRVNSLDLRHHLNWVLDAITPAKDTILQLQTEEGIQMAMMCTWLSAVGHGGPTLWPEQMGALASFNIECTFDIYFLEGD
jgi:hypothetical protein